MKIVNIEESIKSISTEKLIEVMSEQWEGIEDILKEVDNFMIGIETNDFFLSHRSNILYCLVSEEYKKREMLSKLHLMDIAHAHNVTIAGLLATSYKKWIEEKEEDMKNNKDWYDDEFYLHYIVLDWLWKEHDKWAKIIGQTREFNL